MIASEEGRAIARSRTLRSISLITLAAFVCFSCSTTKLPPISSSADAFQPEEDEVRLWGMARDEEAKLRKEAPLKDDPLLEDYLGGIVSRLNTPGMAANPHLSYRVSVVKDPTLNAFAYPHGSLYVHTGLLARMENEDQLATVLGHEMTHVENRHMLRATRSMRNKQIGFSIAALVGAVVVAGEEGKAVSEGKYGKAARIDVLSDILLGLGLALAIMAAVNGYGRDLEREADEGGFAKMGLAGYDIRESPKVYQALKDDHGERSKAETFFFGSHPRLEERIASAHEYALAHPEVVVDSRFDDQAAFRRRMRPIIREDARLNIGLGRYSLAQDQLARVLKEMPEDAEALYLMGLAKVKMADQAKTEAEKQELRQAAKTFLEGALRRDPDMPGPHRELGLLAYRADDFGAACSEFKRYLALAPRDAEEAKPIRDYMLELEQDGHCS